MQELNRHQAVVITGFTGVMACPWQWFQEDIEQRLKRPVTVVVFGAEGFAEAIKELYREEFYQMCPKG